MEKLDQEEVEISELIKTQDMRGEIKKQLNFANIAADEGLEISNGLQEDPEEKSEMFEIENSMMQ